MRISDWSSDVCSSDLLGRNHDAVVAFGKTIALDDGAADAYFYRAHSFAEMGRFAEAVADLDKAIELDPFDDWAFLSRGDAFLELGEAERAPADYGQVIELGPEHPAGYSTRREPPPVRRPRREPPAAHP